MTDVVVTVPLSFGLETWAAEGDRPGEPWSGEDWHFHSGGGVPAIAVGERVYVVYGGRVRGYAPLVRVEEYGHGRIALVRRGGAVAVTIPRAVPGFRGWRYRFWDRAAEAPFPGWATP